MNAKELMIGDWVRVNRDGLCIKKDTIVQVRGIDGDNRFEEKGLVGCANCRPMDKQQYDGGIWVDYLSPIPLTPEILEKNFTRTEVRVLSGTKTHYVESDDFYCVALNEYTDSIWELEYTNCEAHFPLVCVLVAHVHELQNALRLIGIDKEIVL